MTDDAPRPPKSGKLLVRLPVSLHESLALEAEREGVSLNQLVVAKLAVPLAEGLADARARKDQP